MGTRFSLRDLALQAGQSKHETLDLTVAPYHQAGYDYRAPEAGDIAARLDVTAMARGFDFRLRFDTKLHGPCARCLEEASVTVSVDSHMIDDPDSEDPDLVSDHVSDEGELDVSAWAQEEVGLEFPIVVLCQPECKGLCPHCGINRNEASCECVLTEQDTRWEKLRELQLED